MTQRTGNAQQGAVAVARRFAACMGIMACIVLASCSSETEHAGGEPAAGSRLASNLTEYMNARIADSSLSEYQRTILESSAKSGHIAVSDYERAWDEYRSCMYSHGYSEINLVKFSNGMYVEAPIEGGTESQIQQYNLDMQQCAAEYVSVIDTVFGLQQGNANLYADQDVAIVDCFHRSDLVPKDYTVERYRQERSDQQYSIDIDNLDIRSCEVANKRIRFDVSDPNTPVEHPFS